MTYFSFRQKCSTLKKKCTLIHGGVNIQPEVAPPKLKTQKLSQQQNRGRYVTFFC